MEGTAGTEAEKWEPAGHVKVREVVYGRAQLDLGTEGERDKDVSLASAAARAGGTLTPRLSSVEGSMGQKG